MDGARSGSVTERIRNNNAYLLFYDRLGTPQPSPPESAQAIDTALPTDPNPASPVLPVASHFSTEEEGENREESAPDPPARASSGSRASGSSPLALSRQDRAGSLMAFAEDGQDVLAELEGGRGGGPGGKAVGAVGGGAAPPFPASVRRAVWRENMSFFTDKHRFDASYSRFLWLLLKAEATLERQAGIQPDKRALVRVRAMGAGLRFVLEVMCRARALSCLPLWFDFLKGLMARDREDSSASGEKEAKPRRCAEWVVRFMADDDEGRNALAQLLLVCPHPSTRRQVAGLLAEAAKELHPVWAQVFTQTLTQTSGSAQPRAELALGQGHARRESREIVSPWPLGRLLTVLLALLGATLQTPIPTAPAVSHAAGYFRAHMNWLSYYDLTPELGRLLLQVAAVGKEEGHLMRDLGALAQTAALVASMNGGENRHFLQQSPGGEEVLHLCVSLLSTLTEGSGARAHLHRPVNLDILSNRRFVELVAMHHPDEASRVLRRFSEGCPKPAVAVTVVKALVEKAMEVAAQAVALQPNQLPPSQQSGSGLPYSQQQQPLNHNHNGGGAGGNPAYPQAGETATSLQRRNASRALLRVLQEVLSLQDDRQLELLRLEHSLPLSDRCSRILSRSSSGGPYGYTSSAMNAQSSGDYEWVFQVCRLFFALSALSPQAAAYFSSRLPLSEWRRGFS